MIPAGGIRREDVGVDPRDEPGKTKISEDKAAGLICSLFTNPPPNPLPRREVGWYTITYVYAIRSSTIH